MLEKVTMWIQFYRKIAAMSLNQCAHMSDLVKGGAVKPVVIDLARLVCYLVSKVDKLKAPRFSAAIG